MVINLNIKGIIEKIKFKIINRGSWSLFIICFIISAIFNRYNYVYLCSLIVTISIFVIRIIGRTYRFKNNEFVEVEGNLLITKYDEVQRKYQFVDIVVIILNLLLIMDENKIGAKILNNNWSIVVVTILMCLILAIFTVSKKSVIAKFITLILAAIQGFICLILILVVGITILNQVIINGTININNNEVIDAIKWIMISTSILLENYAIYTIVPIIITSLLFVLYIIVTPIYQISNLKKSFQILNIVMVLVGITAFFIAGQLSESIIYNKDSIIKEFMNYKLTVEEFNLANNYILNYGTTNVKNMFYITVLPYTFGMLIANFTIESKMKKSEKKQEEVLVIIQDGMYKNNELDSLKKKFYYNGGKIYELNLSLEYSTRKTN